MPIAYTRYSTRCFVCLDYGSKFFNFTRLVSLEYFLVVSSVRNYGGVTSISVDLGNPFGTYGFKHFYT